MKVALEKVSVEKSNDFKELEYNISTDNLAMFFDMLRNNLYSYPHQSIVREYASNCYDSHVEAGVPNKKFIVSLRTPTVETDGEISFQDFGVGLSPSRMETIFTQYLSSTKRDGNDQIGGFGLGSKSMFSFTERFSIVTNVDGKSYEYLAYIDESRLGRITLLREEDTDLGNGTTISAVITAYKDAELFRKALSTQLRFFRSCKIVDDGEDITSKIIEYKAVDIAPGQAKRIFTYSDPIAIIDQVGYPISKTVGIEILKDLKISAPNTVWEYLPWFKFDIGELQVTMSREELHYTKETKEAIKKAIVEYFKSLKTILTNWLKACDSLNSIAEAYILPEYVEVSNNASLLSQFSNQFSYLLKDCKIFEGQKDIDKVIRCNYTFVPLGSCYSFTGKIAIDSAEDFVGKKVIHNIVRPVNFDGYWRSLSDILRLGKGYKIIIPESFPNVGKNPERFKEIVASWYKYCKENDLNTTDVCFSIVYENIYTDDNLRANLLKDANAAASLSYLDACIDVSDKVTLEDGKNILREIRKNKRKNKTLKVGKGNRLVIPDGGINTSIAVTSRYHEDTLWRSGSLVISPGEDIKDSLFEVLKNKIGYPSTEEDLKNVVFVEKEDISSLSYLRQITFKTNVIPVFITIYKKYRDLLEQELDIYTLEDILSVIPTYNTGTQKTLDNVGAIMHHNPLFTDFHTLREKNEHIELLYNDIKNMSEYLNRGTYGALSTIHSYTSHSINSKEFPIIPQFKLKKEIFDILEKDAIDKLILEREHLIDTCIEYFKNTYYGNCLLYLENDVSIQDIKNLSFELLKEILEKANNTKLEDYFMGIYKNSYIYTVQDLKTALIGKFSKNPTETFLLMEKIYKQITDE